MKTNQSFRGISDFTLHGFGQVFSKKLMGMNPMLRKFMGG